MKKIWKCQRTGLTEGSLIYNEWLKTKGLYRKDTEAEFINWLYTTSGWYDKDITGSYFDIDVEAVKKSENYQRFLREFKDSLKDSQWFGNGRRVFQPVLNHQPQLLGKPYKDATNNWRQKNTSH